jgi:hypothetical protein
MLGLGIIKTSSVLVSKGFSYCGKDFLTSGITGEMCWECVVT